MSNDQDSSKRVRHSPSSLIISDNDETAAHFFEQFCRQIPIPGKLTVKIVNKQAKVRAMLGKTGIRLVPRLPGKHSVETILFLSPTEAWLCSMRAEEMGASSLHSLIHTSPAMKGDFFECEPKATVPAPAAAPAAKDTGQAASAPKKQQKLLAQAADLKEMGRLIEVAIALHRQGEESLAEARRLARKHGIQIAI
ncbi:MAG TPA: hypothetical protein VGE35_01840 [Candidatus Paceibacterota bacterium]